MLKVLAMGKGTNATWQQEEYKTTLVSLQDFERIQKTIQLSHLAVAFSVIYSNMRKYRAPFNRAEDFIRKMIDRMSNISNYE